MRAALALFLLLAGCGPGARKEPPSNQSAEINALAAEVEEMETGVRLRRLEERMGALEAQLGNTALPDMELDMLDNRVRKLEAADLAKRPTASATPAQ